MKIAKVEEHLANLSRQQEDAEFELGSLRKTLAICGYQNTIRSSGYPTSPDNITPTLRSAEKVILFCRIFKGRYDVYPKLWQHAKTGKKGYFPACDNE